MHRVGAPHPVLREDGGGGGDEESHGDAPHAHTAHTLQITMQPLMDHDQAGSECRVTAHCSAAEAPLNPAQWYTGVLSVYTVYRLYSLITPIITNYAPH